MPTIEKPGIYDIPAAIYHADPCPNASLSSGIIKLMARKTPLHAFTEHPRLNPVHDEEDEKKFDIGTVAHSFMLRDPGESTAVLDFKDYRTKAAQEARDNAIASGRQPILTGQFERVMAMVAAGREQLDSSPDFAGVFKDGKPEQSLFWTEGEGTSQIWCRARLDWLPDDLNQPYDDFKTTEVVNPSAWSRTIMVNVGHDIQAAWYRRGIRALGLHRQPKMRFILQETQDPFALSGVEMSGEILELADREIERAISRWRVCRSMNLWPGYPAKFHRAQAPEYLETRRMEREVEYDDMVKEAGGEQALFAASLKRQAPEAPI